MIEPDNIEAIAMLEGIARQQDEWTTLTAILERKAKGASGDAREVIVQELVEIYNEQLGDEDGGAAAVRRIRG